MKLKKLFLDIGFDYEFLLFGLVSSEKPHRLAWEINQTGLCVFERDEDLLPGENEEAAFAKFLFSDEINHVDLYLIANRDDGNYLIPELRNMDFFIVVKGALESFESKAFIAELMKLKIIQLISPIEHNQLKSKQNLIF